MSDTLVRTVERPSFLSGKQCEENDSELGPYCTGAEYLKLESSNTALLAFAEEREKILNALDATLSSTNEAVLRLEAKVEEQQSEILLLEKLAEKRGTKVEEQQKEIEQIKDDIAAFPAYVEYGRAPDGMLASQLRGIFNYHRDTLSTLKAIVERAEAAEAKLAAMEEVVEAGRKEILSLRNEVEYWRDTE